MNKLTNQMILSLLVIFSLILVSASCTFITPDEEVPSNVLFLNSVLLTPEKTLTQGYNVTDNLVKKMTISVNNQGNYASLSVIAHDELLVDSLNIPKKGEQTLTVLVKFSQLGQTPITLKVLDANIEINEITFSDFPELTMPSYQDITVAAGMDKATSIKYGGPTVADIDNDGDYDFIVNNHNGKSSKLYWNNGDGTVSKHDKNLARWFMHDLHGTAAGDYDNDGDLDIIVTQGGGNGKDPSKVNFYTNNDGKLVLTTGDVNINKGGRGRGAKWLDMDLDGDLDLILINEASLAKTKPQHFFYKNLGDGTFDYMPVKGIQDVEQSRAIVTDVNNDHIDDLIFYSPLSVWQGNGNFTFTDISNQIPKELKSVKGVMAMTDIDIDNDGDLDLYLARGKAFEHGKGEAPSLDHNPQTKELSIKPRGYKGVDLFEFTAEGDLLLNKYNHLTQGSFRGKDYPIFLGKEKSSTVILPGDELMIPVKRAQGWPENITDNGVYIGHIGDGKWKAALVRNGNIFWTFRLSLQGVSSVKPHFVPENRNISDVLLRNDNGKFTDISTQWNIPVGGNALGVTVGDFNNDSFQDLFVYRWGYIGARISDYMLLNTGAGSFETVTMHGANDVGGPGNGDMGQAFDFDLDGDVDLLNGSEDGEWYLYSNTLYQQSRKGAEPEEIKLTSNNPHSNNYALVKVGYSPKANVDAISAEVLVRTEHNEYRKRVGSAGAIFSSSLLNIVHFGLGQQESIKSITVRWRNGETINFYDKQANRLFDTDSVDPKSLQIISATQSIRQGTTIQLTAALSPKNASKSLTWSSSKPSIFTVNQQGIVTAVGQVDEKAVITVSSLENTMSASKEMTISKWYPVPIESVTIVSKTKQLIVGESSLLNAAVTPQYADEPSITWLSSNTDIASINQLGKVTAKEAGQVTISAYSKNNTLMDKTHIKVIPYVAPYIEIENADAIKNNSFYVGDKLTLNASYHAGTGNQVISSDEGGVRFWLRLFKYEWIPAKDMVLVDKAALKSTSGTSSATFSLKGLTPSNELPKGYFYYIRATFTSSNGEMHEHSIYPIKIIKK